MKTQFTLVLGALSLSISAQQFADLRLRHFETRHPYGMGALTADLDGDGDQDIVLGNGNVALTVGDRFIDQPGALTLPVGRFVSALGDVDGDGIVDAITTSGWRPIELRSGNGTGRFGRARQLGNASGLISLVGLHDVDGDGDLDLFSSYQSGGPGPDLFLNDGSGTFTKVTSTHLRPNQEGIVSGCPDFNGDGSPDVYLYSQFTPDKILLNDGTGRYRGLPIDVPSRSAPTFGTQFADIDGDGDTDVFYDLIGAPAIGLNDGRGNIRLDMTRLTGAHSGVAGIGDVDGDGDQDVVISGGIATESWINDGSGQFTAGPVQERLDDGIAPRLLDLDGDGRADLFGRRRTVAFGDGTGRFVQARSTALPDMIRQSLAIGDVDGDGDPDLAIGTSLYLNDGAGWFETAPLPRRQRPGRAGKFVDVDGDRDLDFVIADDDSRGAAALFTNDGTGTFTDVTDAQFANADLRSVVRAIDMTGDGRPELLSAAGMILINDGRGTFRPAPIRLQHGGTTCAVGDLDGDGDADVLFGDGTRYDRQQGGLRFVRSQEPGMGFDGGLDFADVNGDGRLDVIGSRRPNEASYAEVFLNQGGGSLGPARRTVLPSGAKAQTVVDVDLDGDLDVVIVTDNDEIQLLENDGAGQLGLSSRFESVRNLGASRAAVVVADVDGDLDPDVVVAGGRTAVMVNRHRQLEAAYLARVGGTLDLTVSDTPGYDSSARIVAAALAARVASSPMRWANVGTWWLDPASTVTLPQLVLLSPNREQASWQVPIPASTGLIGKPVHAQALFVGQSDIRVSGLVTKTLSW